MAKTLMVQGTMSGVGKSLLVAGLCRVFTQKGLRVAPFKSQNMALNSFITRDGFEIGRAQAVQAECCGVEPSYEMNPILLKPTSDRGSQVIVNGEVFGDYSAVDYYKMKKGLWPHILNAFEALSAENDLIIVEGAGSPAEINLKADDFVNMGLAKRLDIPVLLAGDIDRGGVFAQLVGTMALLEPEERELVRATVINKFRGDLMILRPGLAQLEELTRRPVAGVVPWTALDIDDEDSLSIPDDGKKRGALLDIAVVRLPRISNFSDFTSLDAEPGVGVRYVKNTHELGHPDLLILPGTKNTIGDMKWLRESGMEAAVKKLVAAGVPMICICGGYQMAGRTIIDEEGVEGGGEIRGLGLLPIETRFVPEKRRTRVKAEIGETGGILKGLSGAELEGYEIHCGISVRDKGVRPFMKLSDGTGDGCVAGNVYGCYLHGFFDAPGCRRAVAEALAAEKGITLDAPVLDWNSYKETQYDKLASVLRDSLDMELIGRIIARKDSI